MRALLLVTLFVVSIPAYAVSPFCVRDSRGEDKLHFDALFDSAAQNPGMSQEFTPSVLQGFFLRMKQLSHRDPIFAQKLKDAWCPAVSSVVVVKDVFLTEEEKKILHDDQEQVSMRVHVLAGLASDDKQSEITLHAVQVLSHDAQGTHLISETFELESFK